MKILIVLSTIVLMGCGKGVAPVASSLRQTNPTAAPADQSPAQPAILKDIYSLWTDMDHNSSIDSVQLFQSGSTTFKISTVTCSCTGTIDTDNGIVNVNNCPLSNQGTDCSIYLGQYTYQIDNASALKMCPSIGSCAKFE